MTGRVTLITTHDACREPDRRLHLCLGKSRSSEYQPAAQPEGGSGDGGFDQVRLGGSDLLAGRWKEPTKSGS